MEDISIVIPFKQYKHYLKDCLDSLSASEYKNFEIILILDNIIEDINDLINTHKDLKINIIKSEEDLGVAKARNIGIDNAKGKFIYFLDSDDYILESTLGHIFEGVKADTDLVIGKTKYTWNNRANYLDKLLKNLDDEEFMLKCQLDEEKRANSLEDYLDTLETDNKNKEIAIYHLFRKRAGFTKLSVLNNLYSVKFLIDNNIRFNESLTYFSDIPFLVNAIYKSNNILISRDSEYIKRSHNDPINYPSLRQDKNEDKFSERIKAFKESLEIVDKTSSLYKSLNIKMVNFYIYKTCKKYRRSNDTIWKERYFYEMSDVLKVLDQDIIKNMVGWKKRLVNACIDQNMDKVLKITRFRLGKKKLRKVFVKRNVLYKLFYYRIFMKLKVKENVVMFETFFGKNYSDSPKYIYEYLAKNYGDDYKFVWVLNNGTRPPFKCSVVHRFSFRYAYYLARSKYLVFNVRQPLWYRKRNEQVFVETWHGTPLKRLVFDQEEVTAASPKYKQEFFKQRCQWDYLVSANTFSTQTFRSCFMYEGEMLEYGYPRNDILYSDNKTELEEKIKRKLNIPLDKKTILYAPTWRDDEHYAKGKYKFTLALDLHLMKEKLKDEYIVLLRTHHYIADNIDTTGLEGFTYNVSMYDDISELYLISDICITDYSSVFFDYANLKRPILFYTYDIEKYANLLRGFYIDMEKEVPGPLLYTSDEVVNAIVNIEDIQRKYKNRYDVFYDKFAHFDDGNASKNIVERVFRNKGKYEK